MLPAVRAIRPDAGQVPRLLRFAVLHVPGVDLALRAFDFFISDPLHHYMETGMLTGIKARGREIRPCRRPHRRGSHHRGAVGRSGVGPFGLSGPWPALEAAYVAALWGGSEMAGAPRWPWGPVPSS